MDNKEKLLEYLLQFISDNKRNKFDEIIQNRTKHLTVVLEDIYQPHNASAVIRSCDCFGIQDLHIIENKNKYHINPDVALGSSKWVNIHKYNQSINNTEKCLSELKAKGYKIAATVINNESVSINELCIDNKIALVFGTELKGVTETVLENSDYFVEIPMVGFTDSLNISVSAAIFLFYLTGKLRNSTANWKLSEDEIIETKIIWAKNVINKSDLIVNKFFAEYKETFL